MNQFEADLKYILLNMLDKFIQICKEHNLKYTLLGGSVLGAIRHGGIIPWDDDIDIGMPRVDYDKFLSIANKVLGDGYKLISINNDFNYALPFAKLIDNNTTLIESKDYFYLGGVYIDIFPLDGMPTNSSLRFNIVRKLRYSIVNPLFAKYSNPYIHKSLSLEYILTKIIYFIINYTLKACNNLACRFPYSNKYNIVNYFGAWREKEISDYSWFNPLIEHTFEGRKVWIPNNYDAYLTKLYGDYMTPPPIEKRKSHHSHYFIDLTRRYTLEEIREMGY